MLLFLTYEKDFVKKRELADEILERLDKAFELAKKQVDEYLGRGNWKQINKLDGV